MSNPSRLFIFIAVMASGTTALAEETSWTLTQWKLKSIEELSPVKERTRIIGDFDCTIRKTVRKNLSDVKAWQRSMVCKSRLQDKLEIRVAVQCSRSSPHDSLEIELSSSEGSPDIVMFQCRYCPDKCRTETSTFPNFKLRL